MPTKGIPTQAVSGVWDIPSGMQGTIRYHFDRGQIFKLGATGTWFSGKGNVNAFLVTISVKIKESDEKQSHGSYNEKRTIVSYDTTDHAMSHDIKHFC